MQSNASPIPSLLIMEDLGIYDHIALHIPQPLCVKSNVM